MSLETLNTAALYVANIAACSVIGWHAMCAISKMSYSTRWTIRWAYIFLATGAFAGFLFPPETWIHGAGMGGVALVILSNRRERCLDCKGCAYFASTALPESPYKPLFDYFDRKF